MRRPTILLLTTLMAALSGCDQLGIESVAVTSARREAEGKAIGGGCRHAARSVESCYSQNKRADKAAIFAGWREMNDYMRENKIDAMPGAAEPSDTKMAAAEDAGDGHDVKTDKPAKDDKVEKVDKAEKADQPAPKRRRGPP